LPLKRTARGEIDIEFYADIDKPDVCPRRQVK